MARNFKKSMLGILLMIGLLLISEASVVGQRMQQMNIKIGQTTFIATLDSGVAAQGLVSLLPLTLKMTDLNRNEKYADLPKSLPTKAINPGTIQSGDLLLYGSKTLVLFYETFQTTYSYTKLGRIENTDGLVKALGVGDISVTFSLK